MFKSLFKKVIIDLGSANLRMVALDELTSDIWELSPIDFKTKVVQEAACLVKRQSDQKVLAIGQDALAARGRLASSGDIIFPFYQSRIMDRQAAMVLMKTSLKKVFNGIVLNPSLMLVSKASLSLLDKKILSQFFYNLGFNQVNLIAEPLAAAIGAGIPVADSSGTLLLQMGASQLQLSIITFGSLLFNEDSNWAGDRLNLEIIDHLAKTENLMISVESAEELKKQVLSLVPTKASLKVMGKTVNGSNPLELLIKTEDLKPVAEAFKIECESLMKALLAKLPPDLISDAMQKGLLLSGGLARLQGLEDFLSHKFALPVAVLDEPDLAASMGAVTVLKNLELFNEALSFDI
jgi:rod shape-determining protein MreB and related proteins